VKLPLALTAFSGPLMLTLALANPAAAATIVIGHVELYTAVTYASDPSGGLTPLVGASTTVFNTSSAGFLVTATALFRDVVNESTVTCADIDVSAGGSLNCKSGMFSQTPIVQNLGSSFYASASGLLRSATILLPDGSTFVANSTAWSIPLFGDRFGPNNPFYLPLMRDIVIEGTIVPRGNDPTNPPTTPVPEPGTLTLLVTGAAILKWRARARP
jgi:hypothetical protein